MKMEMKKRIKYFNESFITFLNKIPTYSKPTKDILIEIYSTNIPLPISMLVNIVGNDTFVFYFE
jgi:hypothetical protein